MKQIFNRLSDIAKSYSNNNDDIDYIINNSKDNRSDRKKADDELRDIIDNLDGENKGYSESNKDKQTNTFADNKIDLKSAYLIIGVKNNASYEEVKLAYRKKIKEYHPDKVASLGAEIQTLARKKTQEINIAYDLIRINIKP